MIVSPKAAKEAGDKFGLKPVCAGPFKFVERVQQDRIVRREVRRLLEQGQRPHRPHRLPADRRLDGAPRQPQVRQPRPDRARARHRPQGDQGRSEAQARDRASRSATRASRSTSRNGEAGKTARSARTRGAPGARARASTARRSTRSCSTASSCRATSGSARRTPTIRRSSRCRSATSPRPRSCCKEAGVATPVVVDFMVPNNPESRAGRRGDPGDGGGGRLRHEDPRHRVRHLAARRPRRATSRPTSSAGAGASIPTATATSSTSARRRRTYGGYCDPKVDELLDEARDHEHARRAQGDLREARRQDPADGGLDHLSLPPPRDHRAHAPSSRATSRCRTGWCAWSG